MEKEILNLDKWRTISVITNTKVRIDGHTKVKWTKGTKYLRNSVRLLIWMKDKGWMYKLVDHHHYWTNSECKLRVLLNICVSFCHCDRIIKIIKIQSEMVCFGSQFQSLMFSSCLLCSITFAS